MPFPSSNVFAPPAIATRRHIQMHARLDDKLFCASGHFQKHARVFQSNLEQHLRRTAGLAPPLFPVLQRVLADPQQRRKLGLRQTQLAPRFGHGVFGINLKHPARLQFAALNGFRLFHAFQQFIKLGPTSSLILFQDRPLLSDKMCKASWLELFWIQHREIPELRERRFPQFVYFEYFAVKIHLLHCARDSGC